MVAALRMDAALNCCHAYALTFLSCICILGMLFVNFHYYQCNLSCAKLFRYVLFNDRTLRHMLPIRFYFYCEDSYIIRPIYFTVFFFVCLKPVFEMFTPPPRTRRLVPSPSHMIPIIFMDEGKNLFSPDTGFAGSVVKCTCRYFFFVAVGNRG